MFRLVVAHAALLRLPPAAVRSPLVPTYTIRALSTQLQPPPPPPPPPPPAPVAGASPVPGAASIEAAGAGAGTPAATPVGAGGAGGVGADGAAGPPKKTGFWLVDYGGVIGFFLAVSTLGFYLYRQKTGQDRRVALIDALDDSSAVCPGEIKEIRNANLVSIADYQRVLSRVAVAFPSGSATIDQFEALMLKVLRETNPSYQLVSAHHFERARLVLSAPKLAVPVDGSAAVSAASDAAVTPASVSSPAGAGSGARTGAEAPAATRNPSDSSALLPVPQLCALFSYVVDGDVDYRLAMLFDMVSGGDPYLPWEDKNISQGDLMVLIGLLADTWQLPGKSRVRETQQWPYIDFDVKQPVDHLKHGISVAKVDLIPPDAPLAYIKAFDVMRSDGVCVWGECYAMRSNR